MVKIIVLKKNQNLKCEDCDKSYTALNTLRKHVQSVHEGLKHQCEVCKYKTHSRSILVTHSKIHDGKKYRCDICSQYYSTELSLKSHKKDQHDVHFYKSRILQSPI